MITFFLGFARWERALRSMRRGAVSRLSRTSAPFNPIRAS
jgi:hypothetical protein